MWGRTIHEPARRATATARPYAVCAYGLVFLPGPDSNAYQQAVKGPRHSDRLSPDPPS